MNPTEFRNELRLYVERCRTEERRLVKLAENARLRANLQAAAANEAQELMRLSDLDLSELGKIVLGQIEDRLERRMSTLAPLALDLGIDEKALGELWSWFNKHTNTTGSGPTSPPGHEDATWPR